ncbi:hypothetical protein BK184_00705 [Brucella melitensis]|nr:hypothetical protein BK184_00705 [Brucella melitensis]
MPMASVSSCFKSSIGCFPPVIVPLIDIPASKSQIAIELLKQFHGHFHDQISPSHCIFIIFKKNPTQI